MDTEDMEFGSLAFTDSTKTICTCSAISIFIIALFVVSPLSRFFMGSSVMKLIALGLLGYTIYLNVHQTKHLSFLNSGVKDQNISSQLQLNIICSYVFTLFIGLLFIFTIKSFFY